MASDTELLMFVVLFLVMVNAAAALIAQEFNSSSTEYAIKSDELDAASDGMTEATGWLNALRFVGGIFAWSFGLIPTWLDLFMVCVRLLGYYLLIRVARGI